MLDIKADFKNNLSNVLMCPLCMGSSETFSHIFICPSGLDREYDDPIHMVYHEMLKYKERMNWENDVIDLRKKYSLPLNNKNIKNMQILRGFTPESTPESI